MELHTTRSMRRNEQLSKAAAKKENIPAGTPAQSAPKQTHADKLTLSRQALSFLEEQNRKMWAADQEREQRRQDRMSASLSSLESQKNELDALDKKLKVLNKCQKIAASIMKGDHVPPEDLEYLMTNDPEGYKLAMAMRRHKEDPEKCKSVLDDEDKRASASDAGAEESLEVSAPEAPSSDGDTAATD